MKTKRIGYFFTLMNGNRHEYLDGFPYHSYQEALDAGMQYMTTNKLDLSVLVDLWPTYTR